MTEEDGRGCLDLEKAISLCLGDLMGHTQFLLGDDVVGDLRGLDRVASLICIVGFHCSLIIALFFLLSIRFLCFLCWDLRPNFWADDYFASCKDRLIDILD